MQLTASAVLLFVAAVSAAKDHGNPEGGYHRLVGIPMAKRIKAREDRIHSEANTRIYKGKKVFGMSSGYYAFFGGLIVFTVNKSDVPVESVCGSSLLTLKRLVTAAHCWDDGEAYPSHMTVVLGSTYLYYGGVRMHSSGVFTHPNWNSRTLENDIAIIYLPNKVKLSETIFPIALPEGAEITQEFDLYYARTFGFGDTESSIETFFNSGRPSLRTVVLQIISNEKCSKQMLDANAWPPTDDQLCASGTEGRGPCFGDSGGPLVTYTNRKFLVGVFSSIAGQCGQGKPNVYTRVGRYMDFIASHAKLPKFKFHFDVQQDGETAENITVQIAEIDSDLD